MATYQVPRNTKGEGRILMIFSTKALIYTIVGAILGYIIFFFLKIIGLEKIGLIIIALFAGIGFAIATFEIPEIKTIRFTTQVAGLKIDDVIVRFVKHKMKKNRLYVFKD